MYLDMGSYSLHLLLDSLCQDAVGKVHLLHTLIWDPTASISFLTASAMDAVGKVHLLHTWIWDPSASISFLTASVRM
jgi:hypothetical protein